jgi:hypothetical protein
MHYKKLSTLFVAMGITTGRTTGMVIARLKVKTAPAICMFIAVHALN